MQSRHSDRQQYFSELAETTGKHLIPYIQQHHPLQAGTRVLELGCGDGGNLLPFAQMGCRVVGLDLCSERVADARRFFAEHGVEAQFLVADITRRIEDVEGRFDVVLCHDVVEHIDQKQALLAQISDKLADDGIALVAFPAWQMPFGGHQQICHSRLLSHLPWMHLLPSAVYRWVLRTFGEKDDCVRELLAIKRTRTSIECFEKVAAASGLNVHDRTLWFINPHYETKFNLRPRRLPSALAAIPYLRNFLSTSCFYLLKR